MPLIIDLGKNKASSMLEIGVKCSKSLNLKLYILKDL